jgi:hypothetical protein
MIRLICAAVISVGLAAPASAQMVPLRVHHAGSDAVGDQIAAALKTQLATSKRYMLQRPGDLTGAEIRIMSRNDGKDVRSTDGSAVAVLFRVSWVCGKETRPVDADPKLQARVVSLDAAAAFGSALLAEYEAWVERAQSTACVVMTPEDGKRHESAGAVWFILRMEK